MGLINISKNISQFHLIIITSFSLIEQGKNIS